MGHSLQPFFVPLLLLLSAVKFALVAMFYMHLKQDDRIFSGLFIFPLIIATIVILALITLDGLPHGIRQRDRLMHLPFVPLLDDRPRPTIPYELELGVAPQRPDRHRASRCLVLLGHRADAPPAGTRPSGVPDGRSRRSPPP